MKTVRIGTGAGCGNDRIEPAMEIVKNGEVDYIIFECLSERTISIAQMDKISNPKRGYNELLEYRMEKILPICKEKDVKIITNMGAANPIEAAERTIEIAKKQGIKGLKVAVIEGDNIKDKIKKYSNYNMLESGDSLGKILEKIVSANAYLGIEPIVEALKKGADIIITGRVADPSLFLAPLVYEFNWNQEDYTLMGKGTLVGHMLECGAQVTGGYFAEPGYKEVTGLWNLGFPIAEVNQYGDAIITKVEGTGGIIDRRTCTEQLLYEIQDPANYITPDCVADFSEVEIEEIGKEMVSIKGAKGKKRPEKLKVSVGYKDYFIGEGQISYGGSGAMERAKLASEIIVKRLESTKVQYEELKIDFIGYNSLYKNKITKDMIMEDFKELNDIRLRVTARTKDRFSAFRVGNEVESMYTNGPSAGGGATKKVTDVVSLSSILIPREDLRTEIILREV
ncbi:DUF1446 domain-containing protein [Clostridium sporogenes]|uniref:acyclic terpene utilization AtuA family protein n=1 Tax=unclassified Clostridium TaxID=2614128 RepID=UPI0013D57D6A|nr:DUF1446 domain-containing protein [Clostridium sporogenes]NFS26961.1 DUF1446 domain-containing protein [Clostridium sporogenes]